MYHSGQRTRRGQDFAERVDCCSAHTKVLVAGHGHASRAGKQGHRRLRNDVNDCWRWYKRFGNKSLGRTSRIVAYARNLAECHTPDNAPGNRTNDILAAHKTRLTQTRATLVQSASCHATHNVFVHLLKRARDGVAQVALLRHHDVNNDCQGTHSCLSSARKEAIAGHRLACTGTCGTRLKEQTATRMEKKELVQPRVVWHRQSAHTHAQSGDKSTCGHTVRCAHLT